MHPDHPSTRTERPKPGPVDSVVFHAGARTTVAAHLRAHGAQRVLIVTGPRWTALAQDTAHALDALWVGTFDGVTVQVPEAITTAAARLVHTTHADWVLAIGGGSAIGVAKVLALETPGLRLAALPTTYAGSERTNIWGRIRGGEKHTGRDDRVRPQLVVYDPELPATLPVVGSQQSLLNALAHSIEALYAARAAPNAREAATRSLQPLWAAIDGIALHPNAPEPRHQALHGARLASEALHGATMALHHKLAHVLGGSFGTPHGPTHATLLPYTVAFNQAAAPALLHAFQQELGIHDPGGAIHDKLRQHALSVSLADLGLGPDDLERAATEAVRRPYANPRPFDRADIHRLLHGAWRGARPTPSAPDAL